MFSIILIVIFISQQYRIINGKMIFNYPTPEPHKKYFLRIFEKYLAPEQVNFCIDCDEMIHLIPRTVALVTISRGGQVITWPKYCKVDSYILDLTNEAKEKLNFLERNPGWNPRAKFFITYRKRTTRDLLKQLFSKYIVNVLIFSITDNTTLLIRTYDPFKNGELYPKTLETTTLAAITERNIDIVLELDFFPNKYPRMWNNITINVLPVYSPPYIMVISHVGLVGLDFLNLNSAGRRMGIIFNYSSNWLHSWGEKGNDGKYNFALGALQANQFAISVGAFRVNYPEYVDFDMAYPVMEDYLVMVVPAAPTKERWKCVRDILQKSVWVSFIISIFLMAMVFYLRSIGKTEYELSVSFFICLACFLKIPISKMPKSNSQRFLLAFWGAYCFVIDSYFESHLQGAFNVVHREKQIDSFEEIQQLGLKVAIDKRNLQLFANDATEIDRFILRNYYEMDSPIETLNKSLKDHKSSVIVLERFIKYNIAQFYVDYEDGSSTLHILTKKLMLYPLTMYFTKGFPPFERIEKLLLDFKAIGYIERLYRYDEHMVKLFSYRKGTKWKIDPLNISELKHMFLMLLLGLTFSGCILLFEILWYKFITTCRN